MAASGDDQLSRLPDPIIHHIYSFFEHDEMNRVMMMSRNLRDFCMTSPYMAFGAYLHHDFKSASDFNNFLVKLLRTQLNGPLVSLSLSWHTPKDGIRRTLRGSDLPKNLCLQNLQTLVLKFFDLILPRDTWSLSSWICSSCPSLRTLVVHLENCSNIIVLDLTIPHLVTLDISGPGNSSVLGSIILNVSCPSLQHLTIKNFNSKDLTKIRVHTPELRTLCVEGCKFINCSFPKTSPGSDLFTIKAPKLRSFFWKDSAIPKYQCFEESFASLEEAVLEVRHYHRDASFDMSLNKLLLSLQHAARLEIHLSRSRAHGFFASLDTLRRISRQW